MAYTRVPTVAVGDLWTAANHNAYVKDNFAAGIPDIFTAKGDLAVASAANVADALPVGSDDEILLCDDSDTVGVIWDVPSGMFNFGHWTSSDYVDRLCSSESSGLMDLNADFSIPAGARILLTHLKAKNFSTGATDYTKSLRLEYETDSSILMEINHAQFPDTTTLVSQTGICYADTDGQIGFSALGVYYMTVEYWGWAP